MGGSGDKINEVKIRCLKTVQTADFPIKKIYTGLFLRQEVQRRCGIIIPATPLITLSQLFLAACFRRFFFFGFKGIQTVSYTHLLPQKKAPEKDGADKDQGSDGVDDLAGH